MLFYNYRIKEIFKDKRPLRIVSLVPSQTELLYSLGLNEKIIGITKFCIHPQEWFHSKQRIGGTKNINIAKLLSLQPDLIIANKEENVKDQVEALQAHVPVYVTDVHNLDTAMQMIIDIGELTHTHEKAAEIKGEILSKFNNIAPVFPLRTCAYLIWKDPYMTIGSDTFINEMLQYCGLKNIFDHFKRYPEIELENINSDYLLLSSEPYPFKDEHVKELQEKLPGTKVILVDGEMFSWYGSRLLHAPDYYKELILRFS